MITTEATIKRKEYEARRFNAGQCRSCENPRDNDTASCKQCRDRNNTNRKAAYWRNGRERLKRITCSECGREGHNTVTCPINPDREQP